MNYQTGLKLYSTDTQLIPDAAVLFSKGVFSYIELYIIPGSFEETIDKWKGLAASFVIHAPHSFHDVNFAKSEKWQGNQRRFIEAQRFADALSSTIIIIHGGNNGTFEEALRQLALLDESRMALENKPKVGLDDDECVGFSPEEFQKAFDSGVIKQTVLDFGHAVCAANSLKLNYLNLIRELAGFNPVVFHLSDGDASSEKDTHFNLGKGNMNISGFISNLPDGGLVTLETPRNTSTGLEDFVSDINFLSGLDLTKGQLKN
jgi:deoxyribonuclease-4